MKHRIAVSVALIAALCAVVYVRAQEAPIEQFFRTFTADWVRTNPNQATSTRYFAGTEQDTLETQVTPFNRNDWRRRRVELAKRGLATLATFDRAALTDAQRLSADVMRWQLEVVVEADNYRDYAFPLEQFQGANIDLPNTLSVVHPLNSAKDGRNYLARLGQVAGRMDDAVAEARELARKRMIPPRFILNATIEQMREFAGTAASQNPLVTALRDRLPAAVPQAERVELQRTAERMVASDVYPSWQRAIALLESLLPKATDDAGLWRLKGGDAAYAFNLRRYTTTTLSADQIHRIGLREVARIEGEMDAILRRLGRTGGTVAARIARLEKDQAYPLTEDGRTQIIADANAIVADAQQRSKQLFDTVPSAAVVARAFPRFRENNAAANYTGPSRDGSRPGTVQIPLRPNRMTKFSLRTLLYHEAVPGHHFQIALELEHASNPRFRQVRAFGGIPALSEGWALYAERLAAESGWYRDDPEGLLGQLDMALFRARRLVVDTGLHAMGWTRQQAIDYGIEPSEVDRYVVYPGQACAYMLGQLKIVELRDKAQTALGARFSPRAFHDAVLKTGTVPLPLLEQQVDAYIRSASRDRKTLGRSSVTARRSGTVAFASPTRNGAPHAVAQNRHAFSRTADCRHGSNASPIETAAGTRCPAFAARLNWQSLRGIRPTS
jgi:uncharacterized protein (DUF885 family)